MSQLGYNMPLGGAEANPSAPEPELAPNDRTSDMFRAREAHNQIAEQYKRDQEWHAAQEAERRAAAARGRTPAHVNKTLKDSLVSGAEKQAQEREKFLASLAAIRRKATEPLPEPADPVLIRVLDRHGIVFGTRSLPYQWEGDVERSFVEAERLVEQRRVEVISGDNWIAKVCNGYFVDNENTPRAVAAGEPVRLDPRVVKSLVDEDERHARVSRMPRLLISGSTREDVIAAFERLRSTSAHVPSRMEALAEELTRPLPEPTPEESPEKRAERQRRNWAAQPEHVRTGFSARTAAQIAAAPKAKFRALEPHTAWFNFNESRYVNVGEEYIVTVEGARVAISAGKATWVEDVPVDTPLGPLVAC